MSQENLKGVTTTGGKQTSQLGAADSQQTEQLKFQQAVGKVEQAATVAGSSP